MLLQLALDSISFRDAESLLYTVKDVIDIAEVGTPFIIREGIGAVAKLKDTFPDLTFLADVKIVDGAEYESQIAFEAGADIVTVLGVSDIITIKTAVDKAEKYGRSIMVDMINVDRVIERAPELDTLGVAYLCLHTAFDVKSLEGPPLEQLKQVKGVVRNAKIAIAGGINDRNAAYIVKEKPEILIVGSWIVGSKDPLQAARALKNIMTRG